MRPSAPGSVSRPWEDLTVTTPGPDPAARTRHVALWGADHPDLGRLAVAALDPGTAVAISAGRLPKPYAHLDANEDAVMAVTAPHATLLAVADGHSGFDAARAALAGVRERSGLLEEAEGGGLEAVAGQLLLAARGRVREELADAAPERRQSRTALSVAVLSGRSVVVGGWGDTQVLRIRGRRAKALGADGPFLDPSTPAPVPPVTARLRDGDVVLACSDGLRDYLGGDWAARSAEVVAGSHDAGEAARRLVEAAWEGGAGDHVSVAVTQWEG